MKNYMPKKIIAVVDATFAVGKSKPFAVASITAMILVLSYNCLCIVCINVEKLSNDLLLAVALKIP